MWEPNPTTTAVDFLTAAYLTPAEQVRRYQELGYLPTRRSVFDDPALLGIQDDFCGGQRLFEIFSTVVDDAPVYYQSADASILETVLSGHLLAAYNGDESPCRPSSKPRRTSAAGPECEDAMTSTVIPAATTATTPPAGTGKRRVTRAPYVFIAPFFVLYGLFLVVPLGAAVYLSLTEWVGLGTPTVIGLDNYANLVRDTSFHTALGNSTLYVLVAVFIVVPLALLIAQLLNTRGLRGRDLFRAAFFVPMVLIPIVIALVYSLLLDREYGVLNAVLQALFGVGDINWLGDPTRPWRRCPSASCSSGAGWAT